MLRRLLASSRNRFIIGCCLVAPVLGGCAGITMSCVPESRQDGTLVATGVPAAAERGAMIRVDLTGTRLNEDKAGDPFACIEYVTAWWSGASIEDSQRFEVPKAQQCGTLSGFTIDVKVPTTSPVEKTASTTPYVGGTLSIQASGPRPIVDAPGWIDTAGSRKVALASFTVTVPAPANAAPVADLFPRYSPMPSRDYQPVVPPNGDAISADAIARSFAAIDARMSTDPEGGALTYAWDLDGDGVYGGAGDAPSGGTGNTDLPAGVAIVPADRRQAPGTSTGEIEVGVRVTDPAGLVGTKRIIVTVQNQGYYPVSRKITGLDTATPTVGGTVNVQFDASGTEMVCIVGSGSNPLSSAGTPFDIYTNNLAPGKTFPIAVSGTGPHRVTVALLIGQTQLPDCANVGNADVRYVWSDVYTPTAARRATRPYTARARLTVRGMTPLAATPTKAGPFENVIARGRYVLATPAKGGGVKRPAALRLFRRGDVVSSSPSLDFLGAGPNETMVGRTTMLLRGTGGALACVQADATAGSTTYTFLGGTGAARRLTAKAVAGAAAVKLPAKAPKRVTGQKRPARGNATVVASTGAPRGLPAACRALVKRLP